MAPVRRFPRSLSPAVLLAVLVLLLAACSRGGTGGDPTASPRSTPAATLRPTSEPAYPVTVVDAAGREVTIPAEPQRIVSLAPSNTEIVCALDACDRLVATDDFRTGFPPEVLAVVEPLPTVVTFTEVDLEGIVAAEPDLVLAAGNELTPSDDIAALDELGLTVVVLYPETLDEIYEEIELMGRVLGQEAEADALVGSMRDRVDAVTAAVEEAERPRTFYEVSLFEGTIYTAGSGSFLASMIELAGGDPITGDPQGVIQVEQLVEADPQLILLGDASYDPTLATPEQAVAAVAARPGWDTMSAVRDGRVVPFLDDIVTTRPGPRIVDGLEALASAIHPELADAWAD